MERTRTLCLLTAAIIALGACAPLARVHAKKAELAPPPGAGADLQHAEQAIADGGKLDRRDPRAAMGKYLDAMEFALERLRKNPADAAALRDYNFALSRVFTEIGKHNLDPWSKPMPLPAAHGTYSLTWRGDTGNLLSPANFDFTPVDQLAVGGAAFAKPALSKGLGAPLVAVSHAGLPDYHKRFVGPGRIYYGITAIARFEGGRCVISFEDPLSVETVNVGGRNYPLAADFTTAGAVLLAKERPERLGLIRLLLPERYASTARLSFLQPFDPRKIPVLFIHGLQDTPATWAPMINVLRDDPVIRRNYQFWVFSYPSGYPFPYSAMLLRRELDAVHKAFPNARRMVVVGHSMGGLVARLMVTDAGNKIWYDYFKKMPAATRLPPEDKAVLVESLIFKHRPEVARVIFISTPHRGSIFASNWIGRIASSLVKTPGRFLALAKDTLQVVAMDDPSALKINHIPNSIDTLSPNNRFVKIMNTLPITAGVPYHSIMGDRGRGDAPHSSDGVVPYWSSHLDGAQSERIVPSYHAAHQNPEGIAEVDRILKLHLAKQTQ